MKKRIRHALMLALKGLWKTAHWHTAPGKPWRKRPRMAFTRISMTAIVTIAAVEFGGQYVTITQVTLFVTTVVVILLCLPTGEQPEEKDEHEPEEWEDFEEFEAMMTVRPTPLGPEAIFDDPFNPARTHIIRLDKRRKEEDFAA